MIINRIAALYDDNDVKLVEPYDTEKKIHKFYGRQLGSCASQLPVIHLPTMRSGPTLSMDNKVDLCKPTTISEIDQVIAGISNDNAPGLDGMKVVFFKKSWGIIKKDIVDAILEFFSIKKVLK